MKRVGVIGGGQLAWMMAPAAQKLDMSLVVQTPQESDPAVTVASRVVLAAVADAAATEQLAKHCDVITFENEFVDLAALAKLEAQGVCFYPKIRSLAPLLDKLDQRQFLQQIGVPTPRFTPIAEELKPQQLSQFGWPTVLKTRRHGYDGQGTFILEATDTLPSTSTSIPWLLEEYVPFQCELAVMAARSATGEIVIYPVVETQQEAQVCRRVFATGFESAADQAEAIACRILQALDYVGVMGIEFFLTRQGLLVNELAPRTHNSGHYTLDACATSQFEQQLRAVAGLPLGSPELTCAGAVMVNLLGYEVARRDYQEKRSALSQIPNASVYWYGKTARPGRKLGHVTVRLEADQLDEAEQIAEQIEQLWYPAFEDDEDIYLEG
ncbi:MAG: 5-(carboxyamino)imidazole ribonucleotide synthase [Elainella sp.]